MRIFTSLIVVLLTTFALNAQIVLVNSPSGISGVYSFSAAGFGRVLTDSIWTADVAFIDSGGATPNQGCTAATNDLTGKIALVDRGSCEFGIKCLNAENAGAIAVVVFNNAAGAGTIVMGAGVNGGSVTIPCVMLSLEDGQAIRNALANGPVNMTIGNVRFPNDLRSTVRTGLMNAPRGTTPLSQIDGAGAYTFTPGVRVENYGLSTATGIAVEASITHSTAGEVYTGSASFASLDSDSSQLITMPAFDPFDTGIGTYTVNYTISSDSTDALPGNNTFSTSFGISEDVFSLARWDETNRRALTTNAYTISGGGNIEFLTPLPIANGAGFRLDSVIFYASTAAPGVMSDITTINAFLYGWEDLNADGAINNDEIELLALLDNVQYETPAAAASWIRARLLDIDDLDPMGYDIPGDDRVYFIGVRYEGDAQVFFGFDENQDLTQYLDFLGATATDLDLPYIGTNTFQTSGIASFEDGFLFTGFRGSVATAVVVTQIPDNTDDLLSDDQLQLNVFPNPTANLLTADLKLAANADKIAYRIVDANGRMVFQAYKQNVQQDRVEFNVATLPAGQYFLVVSTGEGFARRAFTVQR